MKKKYKINWSEPTFSKLDRSNLFKTFDSGWVTMGSKVKIFEKLLAKHVGKKYAVAVTNGTVALELAYKAVNINAGDEVIVPAISYFSTISALSNLKAKPVFVDIENETYNIDPSEIEKAITKKTKAIAYIDYGGNPAQFKKLKKISKKYNLTLVQDAAQTLGCFYKNKSLANVGDICTMSFHLAKIITSIEGGMIFTNNKKTYEKLKILRNIGEKKKYFHTEVGTNARMTDLTASIGISQFNELNNFLKKRKTIADLYFKQLSKNKLIKFIRPSRKYIKNSNFLFSILISNRDKVMKYLKRFGIDTRVAYPMPIFDQPAYKNNKKLYRSLKCPKATEFSKKILNIPIYPKLKRVEIMYISKMILNATKGHD